MGWLGGWQGDWPGNWFGGFSSDPNAIAGATSITFFGAGALTAAGGSASIRVWDGAAWVEKPVKVWDGAAWLVKPVRRWDGGSWV